MNTNNSFLYNEKSDDHSRRRYKNIFKEDIRKILKLGKNVSTYKKLIVFYSFYGFMYIIK